MISRIPGILAVGAILWGAILRHPHLLLFGLLSSAWSGITHVLKKVAAHVLPPHLHQRPGCPPDGCELFGHGCTTADGFPSGHAQYMVTFAVYWSLWLLKRASLRQAMPLILGVWILAVIVIMQRIHFGGDPRQACHTPLQVLAGIVLGLLFGVVSIHLIPRIYSTFSLL